MTGNSRRAAMPASSSNCDLRFDPSPLLPFRVRIDLSRACKP
jgi:hypothetical protein